MSSEKSILEYSNLANNNNPNCYLMSQNWWSQVDNNTIFHPISTNSSLSSCNTNRSSSCEEDVISISNNNNNNGNSVTNNNNNNNLHQYQFLLGVDEINNSSLISGENIAANSHDHNQHIWSQLLFNLLGRPLNYYTNNNNDDDMDSMFPMRSDQIAHHQEVDNSRNLASICFGDYLNNKPLVDFKPSLKTLNLGQHKKNGLQQPYISKSRVTLSTCNTLKRSNGRSQEYNNPIDGKKRKLEDNLETNSKGQKNENSVVTSAKTQVPKVKLADKVTALQQIVSPFGKTDTASVLWETINYVRFLQEQIQLLSHAYMKSNTCKERYWGGFDRKEIDLRSKGLCLVPISCTPQIYHETNNGSDYLIPSYRGCLYR
ncbi:transcription factor bHLH111 isoform X3 [Solanum pennellii]|uniref:Transcription factor bHLH111 isoform X3 n=1 Tax=Solanum pennellii TaxID=28526 RepID=A0ABM1UY08_SOLPN|nr:transcription factor bHLH111 isoform X3 [Solanum pennellii]